MLTTVYDTNPDFLHAAASSVFQQTEQAFEWILLDNGSSRSDVQASLLEIARDGRVHHLRVEENLGIIGGMRRSLEAAQHDWVVPFDSDDVLLPDALTLLAEAIEEHPSAAFVYTDEDVLRDGRVESPYLRPDWDPVLNICTSYIFHLCAFRRSDAFRLGVYTDDAATWCHDWDTVHRFASSAAEIVHVPEVAYHWRSHRQSTTHRATPERGSLDSQRHVLARVISAQERPELFEVRLFPIDRGAPELWVRRRRNRPAPIDVVLVTSIPGSDKSSIDRLNAEAKYPFRNTVVVDDSPTGRRSDAPLPRPSTIADIAKAVADDGLTLVYSDAVSPEGDEWPWEAQGHFELHDDAVLASGRILNEDGLVVAGGEILGFDDLIGAPDYGRSERDPGYYALALKQRSVSACHRAFFLARSPFLKRALGALPPEATLGFLGAWLGAAAMNEGRRVVFSPLITARAHTVFDGRQLPQDAEARRFSVLYGHLLPDLRWYSPHFSREGGHAYEVAN